MSDTRKHARIYNYDNLARKYSAEDEKHQIKLEKIKTRSERNHREREQAEAGINFGIDLFSAVLLTASLACILVFALGYLTLSARITEAKADVSALTREYNEIKTDNDGIYAEIDASVDIGYVYETAVTELGMVYPDDNQIVTYELEKEGYVKQYMDVPEK